MRSAEVLHGSRTAARSGLALLMLGLWLGLAAVAVSPDLHAWLHSDASVPSHVCLATKFSQGQMLGGFAAVVLGVPAVAALALPLPSPRPAVVRRDLLLAPGRAPPVRGLPTES